MDCCRNGTEKVGSEGTVVGRGYSPAELELRLLALAIIRVRVLELIAKLEKGDGDGG